MSDIIPFEFKGYPIRVHVDEHGKPWWVARDVCEYLGLRQVTRALARLRPYEKALTEIKGPRGMQQTNIISESAVYRFIARSNKPEAEEFQDWLFETVVPSIMHTGRYEVQPKASDAYPELQAIHQLVESVAEAWKLAEEAQEKAHQADLKATLALAQQQWLTIHEYVYLHPDLRSVFPEPMWSRFGRYLTSYCLQNGYPVRNQGVGGKRYESEHSYHVEIIHERLPDWLMRQSGQAALTLMPRREVD